MNYEQLADNLAAVGKPPQPWQSPDGTRLLILPDGGRILGLFTATDASNFLWVHPDLESPQTASRVFDPGDWQNPGGDRTWLAPEVDFFLPDYPNCDRYRVQSALDPGHYQISRQNDVLTLTNRATLTSSRHKRPVQVAISKSVGPALNPLRHETRDLSEIAYAGYTLRSTLQAENAEDDSIDVGLWNLLQLPHGGEMIVPTVARSEPRVCVGHIPPGDITVTDRIVRYNIRAPGEQKIGLPVAAILGRAGYIYTAGDQVALVMRSFNIDENGNYIDVHWKEPDGPGTAFQACNVNVNGAAFSELEYHAPAIGQRMKSFRSDDESQVWAFRGSQNEIMSVARRLLAPGL